MEKDPITFEEPTSGFRDRYLIGLLLARGARLLAVEASGAADEVRVRHELEGAATRLAAEGVLAAELMGAYIKGEERITLQVLADSPSFNLLADVRADGAIRARFKPSQVGQETSIHGRIGVIKHDRERELYRGVAAIPGTDFQGALQGYLVHSQQTVGLVRLGVSLDGEGRVGAALGVLVEKLPDMDERLFHDVFADLPSVPLDDLREMLGAGHLMGIPVEPLDSRQVRFSCTCSPERARSLVVALGVQEMRALLQEQGQAEVCCDFCRERYVVPGAELEVLLQQAVSGQEEPSDEE